MNEEIKFLLSFDWQNAGAKEAEDWLTRFIAYFGDFQDVVGTSSAVLDKYNGKLKDVEVAIKNLGNSVQNETGLTKENSLAMQMAFQEAVNYKKAIEAIIAAKANLTKTTEQLTGELKKAESMVKSISGKMLEMETAGKSTSSEYQALGQRLNEWKNILISCRVEMDGAKAVQEQFNGVITQTKERIKELTILLDSFTTTEELASKEAQGYKNELAALNNILKQLQKETSGQLTLENALNVARANNIKMTNELVAIEKRDIEAKAQLTAAENRYKSAVKERVSVIETGMTLEQRKAQETAEKHEAAEKKKQEASNKTRWSLDNVIDRIDVMGVRVLASMFWWGLVLGAATALYDWWTKIDDAQERAQEGLKSYFDSFKSSQDSLEKAPAQSAAEKEFNINKAERALNEMISNPDMEKKFNKYKEIQSSFSKVFDDLNKDEFGKAYGGSRMEDQIKTLRDYISALHDKTTAEEQNLDALKRVRENERLQEKISKDIAYSIRSDKNNALAHFLGATGQSMTVDEANKYVKGISDQDIIKLLRDNVKGRDKDPNAAQRWMGAGVTDQVKILNSLADDQIINRNNEVDTTKELDRLEHKITMLEGNTRTPKTGRKGKNPLEDELRTARDRNRDNQQRLTEGYEANAQYNTYEDDVTYQEQRKSQAKKYFDEMVALRDKYEGSQWETKERYKQITLEADKERKLVENEANKAEAHIFEERRKRYNQAIKDIEDFNRRAALSNKELQKSITDYQTSFSQGRRKAAFAKKVNPLLASQGIDDEYGAFKLNQANLSDDIARKTSERDDTAASLSNATQQKDLTREWLNSNGGGSDAQDAKAVSNDKSGLFKLQLDEFKKYSEEEIKLNKELVEKDKALALTESEKKLLLIQKEAQAKKETIQKTFDFANMIANREFELQKQRIQSQIAMTQANYQFELSMAGNNSAARMKLARQEQQDLKRLKREEAKVEKEQAIFSAILNTVRGESAILGKYGAEPYAMELIALTAAMGFAEVGFIAARPLPAYWKGRRGGKQELATLNEKGPEVIEDKEGRFKIYGGGKEGVGLLEEGDIVHTHEESKKLRDSDNFMRSLLRGTGVHTQKQTQAQYIGISKREVKEAFSEAIKEMPTMQLPADAVVGMWSRQAARNGTL